MNRPILDYRDLIEGCYATMRTFHDAIHVLRAGSSAIKLGVPKARWRCVWRRRARVGYFLFQINAAAYGVAAS